ncbi:hypothetical protein PaecuDRAFT_3670 [Paenibacillus curdlanolyticus YK9]|uniref:Putative sensor domain-containing protein n=1 Tax=Paenibacillus curdlanolyticus YK9 TaxID=717606 RepID=E0IDG6_9BACL|nr:sensor domain-containing protein [Paenibacillus curdlanolyticus]EFM09621.1 hypothetical protein PaecuDRAFT_3670 [Paenibacillus curdlanolyticus YK9]
MHNTVTQPQPEAAQSGALGRYMIQTIYMTLITLPLSIIGFTLSVTLIALGFGLVPILIGLPLLKLAVHLSHALMMEDVRRTRGILPAKAANAVPHHHAFGPFTYRELLTTSAPYVPLGYWLGKLPAAIGQFAAAVVFPVCGMALLFSPAVYLVLERYGIPSFQDDVVFDVLTPALTGIQRAYIGTGVGVLFLMIGGPLLAVLARSQGSRIAGMLHPRAETVTVEAPVAKEHNSAFSFKHPLEELKATEYDFPLTNPDLKDTNSSH